MTMGATDAPMNNGTVDRLTNAASVVCVAMQNSVMTATVRLIKRLVSNFMTCSWC